MRSTLRFTLAALLLASATAALADTCRDLAQQDRTRLEAYVAKRYRIPEKVQIQLREQTPINALCYRKLVFQGQGPLGKIELKLYASPDLRFLSTDILDSSLDPEQEERDDAKKMMAELLEGEYASRGPATAPVTLVEFSDFQCPFCRRMQQMLSAEPLLKSGNDVRLVFRHMPLSQHDWAQQAAEAAACVQFQNAAAFWQFQDSIFGNQDKITRATAKEQLSTLASKIPGLNMADFKTCMERQMSLGVVVRDRELGAKAGVSATPTLFLNGEPLPGIRNGVELHRILTEALERAKPNQNQTAQNSKNSASSAASQ